MKRITQTLLLLLVLVASVSSCKKKEDAVVAPAVAIIGKWKLVSIALTVAGQTVNQPLEDCQKDDILEFFTSPKATLTNGALKCDPADLAVQNSTYSLSADGKTLTIDGEVQTVTELSSSTMKLQQSGFGLSALATFTKI